MFTHAHTITLLIETLSNVIIYNDHVTFFEIIRHILYFEYLLMHCNHLAHKNIVCHFHYANLGDNTQTTTEQNYMIHKCFTLIHFGVYLNDSDIYFTFFLV